jgi:hypothetical protein
LSALAVVAVLTASLVGSVGMQEVAATAPGAAQEEAARVACGPRLVHAAEAARTGGDEELARWIEALPAFPKDQPLAALP